MVETNIWDSHCQTNIEGHPVFRVGKMGEPVRPMKYSSWGLEKCRMGFAEVQVLVVEKVGAGDDMVTGSNC